MLERNEREGMRVRHWFTVCCSIFTWNVFIAKRLRIFSSSIGFIFKRVSKHMKIQIVEWKEKRYLIFSSFLCYFFFLLLCIHKEHETIWSNSILPMSKKERWRGKFGENRKNVVCVSVYVENILWLIERSASLYLLETLRNDWDILKLLETQELSLQQGFEA